MNRTKKANLSKIRDTLNNNTKYYKKPEGQKIG